MRVVSFNVNGIRAAARRGFADWLAASQADVVALQEVRARVPDVPAGVFSPYHLSYDPGELAGRNGVALLTRQPPSRVFRWSPGIDSASNPWADEGRLIGVDLADAPLTVLSVYVPKGGLPLQIAPVDGGRERHTPEKSDARYQRKMAFLARLATELDALFVEAETAGRHLLVLGDFNIAHGPADLRNWRSNLASEGFLPGERAWMDALVGPAPSAELLVGRRIVAPGLDWPSASHPLVDVVRALNPGQDGPYSWWSWFGRAFENDVGWRIDYHLASPGLVDLATKVWVDRATSGAERVSDHAAVVADYSL